MVSKHLGVPCHPIPQAESKLLSEYLLQCCGPSLVNFTMSKFHDKEQKQQEIVQPYLVVAAVHHLLQGVNLYQAALKNKYQEEKISSINTSIPMLSNFHCLLSDCISHRFSEY